MASITKQSNGRYRAQIVDPNPKRVGKSGFHTKTEAKSWLTKDDISNSDIDRKLDEVIKQLHDLQIKNIILYAGENMILKNQYVQRPR